MLMRFDPFRELDRFSQQLSGARSSTPIDAYRHGDTFTVLVDVPGVDPEAIDVTVEKNVVSIKAERTSTPTEGDDVLVSERPHGVFSRRLFLGEGLDATRLEAAYDHGVLTLTVPVAEQLKPRRVSVTAVTGGAPAGVIDVPAAEAATAEDGAAEQAA
jgi:HSP20 family protein